MRALRVLAIAWTAVCTGVLAVSLMNPDGDPEAQLFLLIAMNVLTFPAGYLYALLLTTVAQLSDTLFSIRFASDNDVAELVLVWAGFLVFGYAQWFVLTPWLYRKVRASRDRRVENVSKR
jgi:hypothetical protein